MKAKREDRAAKGVEGRRAARVRTRLRSARIFTTRGGFVADAAFFDISTSGARLRFFGKMRLSIPHHVRIFDEVEKRMRDGEIVWRSAAGEFGVHFI